MEGAAVRRSASGGEGGDTSRQRAASTNASQRFGAARRPMPPSAYSGESSLGYDAGEYYGDSVGETQMANGSPSAASVEKAVVNGSASGSNSQVQPSPVENGPEVSSVPDAADPLPTPTEEVKAGQSMAASEPDETPQHSDAMDLPSEKEIKSLTIEDLGTNKDSQYRTAETTLLKALKTANQQQTFVPGSANLKLALAGAR